MSSKVRLLLAVLVLCTAPLAAQDADLFPTTDLNARGVIAPYPLSDFLRAGDSAVFVKETRPAELWVTDGTAQGTRRLPVECDPCRRLELVGGDGSRVYFSGGSRAFGVTDGTPNGTRPLQVEDSVATIHTFQSRAFAPKAVGERLFFVVETFDGHFQPWVTDGTPEGTFPLLDASDGFGAPRFGAELGGELVFVANSRLWRSDGTRAGTVLLSDPESIHPAGPPVRLSGRALFFVEDVESGAKELWSTDGTWAGTRFVSQVPETVNIRESAKVVGDLIFFVGEPATGGGLLWRSDGTTEGTFQAARIRGFHVRVTLFTGAGDAILFFVSDTLEDETTVWRSDGTADGTFSLELSCEPDCRLERLAELGDRLFLNLRDPQSGAEMWVSDGTPQGTRLVADLCPGPCSGDPEVIVQAPDALYLSVHHPLEGRELYRFQAGSEPLRLTSFELGDPFSSVQISELGMPFRSPPTRGVALSQGSVFPATESGTGLSVYLTRGTPSSTRRGVTLDPALNAGSSPSDLTRIGEDVVFLATDGILPRRIWRTNGFPGGTAPLDVLPLGPGDGGPFEPFSLLPYRSGFVVWAQRPNGRYDLWRWTPDAAERLAENLRHSVLPNRNPPPPLTVAQENVFFVSQEGADAPARLWVSDGTPDGTRVVREFDEIVISTVFFEFGLEAFGNRVAFAGTETDGPQTGVWISDGTAAGTRLVFQRPGFSEIEDLATTDRQAFFALREAARTARRLFVVVPDGQTLPDRVRELKSDDRLLRAYPVGSKLFFLSRDDNDLELWVTEGTRSGTRFLTALDGFPSFASPTAVLGNTFYILSGSRGDPEPARIVATDGTPSGTTELDLLPTTVRPTGLAAAGRLLVIETMGLTQKRLWVSDGGTEPAQPLGAVFDETDLTELTSLGTVAVFPADDGTTGREPWTITTGPLPPCEPGPQTLCVTQDRFRVEVDWRDPRSGDTGRGFVVPGTQLADSGFFWFFDEDNVELVVKVLDARPVNGHFWVFSGSLTDVERTITVTDTQTGAVQTYHREAGNSTGQIDVTAF